MQDKQALNQVFLGVAGGLSVLGLAAGGIWGVSAAFVDWDNHGRSLGEE